MQHDNLTQLEIESLRSRWRTLSDRIDRLEESNRQLRLGRCESSRDRLRRHFRTSIIVCAAMVVIYIPVTQSVFPLWLAVLLECFFAVMGVCSFFLYRKAGQLDFTRQTLAESLELVYSLKRSHTIVQAIGIVLCIPLLALMFRYFAQISMPMLYGGIAGMLVGLPIGIMRWRRQLAMLRELRSQIEESLSTSTSAD